MISRYNVWLDDVPLSSISPDILITDIGYRQITPSRTSTKLARRDGTYTGAYESIEANAVTISFIVRSYRTESRQQIVQDITTWAAKGGWLKCSDRLGQKIYVKCSKYPVVGSALQWLSPITVEFTAYDYPFWVSEFPAVVTLDSGESGSIYNFGVLRSCAEISVLARDNIDSIDIQVGDTGLHLSDLNAIAGDIITVTYTDDHHIQEIKQNDVSILDKRTSASDDDLIAKVGENDVEFSAENNGAEVGAFCTITVKGVYL